MHTVKKLELRGHMRKRKAETSTIFAWQKFRFIGWYQATMYKKRIFQSHQMLICQIALDLFCKNSLDLCGIKIKCPFVKCGHSISACLQAESVPKPEVPISTWYIHPITSASPGMKSSRRNDGMFGLRDICFCADKHRLDRHLCKWENFSFDF